MNSDERIDVHAAELAQEYEVRAAADTLHGVAFVNRWLVLASGRYLFRLMPGIGRLIDQLETFPAPGGLAHRGKCIWQLSAGHLQQLDARTGFVVRSVATELEEVTGLECIAGDLLILHRDGRALARIHLEDHAQSIDSVLVRETETNAPLKGLTWDGGELWSSMAGALVRLDPDSARIVARLRLGGVALVSDLAADAEGRFWCVDGLSRMLRVFARPRGSSDKRFSPRHPLAPPSLQVVDVSAKELRTDPEASEPPVSVAGATFARILVPVDFSAASRRALATALVMQDRLGSEVHLLHLTEQGANDEFLAGIGAGSVPPAKLVEDALGRLRRFVDNLFPGRSNEVVVHAHIDSDVVHAVERAAVEIRPSLVILSGRPRQTFFRTHIERITRGLDAAVMVLSMDAETQGTTAAAV